MKRRSFLKMCGIALVAPVALAKTPNVINPLPCGGELGTWDGVIFNTDLIRKIKIKAMQSKPKIKPLVIEGKKYYIAYDSGYTSELKNGEFKLD